MENDILKIQRRLDALEQRRVSQGMIISDQVKQRHQGEGNRFVRSGLAANRPTEGEPVEANSSAIYFARDTGVLSIWDGVVWLEVTLV